MARMLSEQNKKKVLDMLSKKKSVSAISNKLGIAETTIETIKAELDAAAPQPSIPKESKVVPKIANVKFDTLTYGTPKEKRNLLVKLLLVDAFDDQK